MSFDKGYWNRRWVEKQTAWDTGTITTPLKEYFEKLENKNLFVLIPGAGSGYEAAWLHDHGFKNVHLLDLAPAPLEKFARENQSFPESHIHCEDFFDHKGSYDLIVEQTFFCALHPDFRNKYIEKMHALLKPGGKLAGVLFGCEFDGGPPFGGSREDYLKIFGTRFKTLRIEPCYNSIPPREGRELFVVAEKD